MKGGGGSNQLFLAGWGVRIGLSLASLGGSAAAPSTSGFAAAAGKPAAEDAADPDSDACWPCHKKGEDNKFCWHKNELAKTVSLNNN